MFQVLHLVRKDKVASQTVRVKLLMEAIITYDVAVHFSWTGLASIHGRAAAKHCVSDMPAFRHLIMRCISYRTTAVDVDARQVDKDIQQYFRRANFERKKQITQ